MTLLSKLFRGDSKLEAAAVSDPAHILIGAIGQHVAKIQRALMELDGATIDRVELQSSRYGPSTANAVLAYKKKRNIVNHSYQTQADNIVGKMTITAMDQELARMQPPANDLKPYCYCGNHFARHSGGSQAASSRFSAGFLPMGGPQPVNAGQSPKMVALSRVGKAKEWITTTLAALERANIPGPSPHRPTPIQEWQGLNANFGLPHGFSSVTNVPGVPPPIVPVIHGFLAPDVIKTKQDYITHLIHMYSVMRQTLNSSNTLINETFLKKPGIVGEKTYAITLTRDHNPLDSSLPDGLYFTDYFVTAGENKQTEVLIHECAHFLANSQILDVVYPDDPNYTNINPREAITNAYSFSTFVIHSVFHFTGVLDHNR
jgi:hypothetical protein